MCVEQHKMTAIIPQHFPDGSTVGRYVSLLYQEGA